ncbi:hypothetical protein HMPREF1531_02414 [Propionibacterium sp. oral taxon 192 str. F0372]|uniref:putative RNA methyltransferase n=1 Tax=Propionibacterium sp. oral taxon 192 TaxID=671222 RepID=UPI00035301F1|nr:hypothetical protein [Propionibacterium sp. oral taxon 192]EPH00306.1 hypothetical protein HMPREF1531_02414 [Propionibacterium sp. oral taxon 192 str. F0372]
MPATQPIDAGLDLLACPVCSGALSRDDRVVRCPHGHSFDIARQGQLNLLGRSSPPNADTMEMVAARARFLDSGAYGPIMETLVTACANIPGPVVEVGAGTGHYLRRLLSGREYPHLAVDVSAMATRWAARHGLASVVADTWAGLPLRDATVGLLACIFAPRNPSEFARILRPGGSLVVVTPTVDHLVELRRLGGLLEITADKLDRLDAALGIEGIKLTQRTGVRFPLHLGCDEVADLVGMGPNAFHTARTAWPALDTTASVSISVFTRR